MASYEPDEGYVECPRCQLEYTQDEVDDQFETIPDYGDGRLFCPACVAEYEEMERRIRDELLSELRDMVNDQFYAEGFWP
jgi:uncharacterized Zn finger protein (UPF0148 family)